MKKISGRRARMVLYGLAILVNLISAFGYALEGEWSETLFPGVVAYLFVMICWYEKIFEDLLESYDSLKKSHSLLSLSYTAKSQYLLRATLTEEFGWNLDFSDDFGDSGMTNEQMVSTATVALGTLVQRLAESLKNEADEDPTED